MKIDNDYLNISTEGVETPWGYLYPPPKQIKQILFLVAAFFAAILQGWVVSNIPGDLSDFAKGVIYFIYLLVFFLGYAAWSSWLGVIVFKRFKLSLIKTLFGIFLRREKPESLEKLLPTKDQAIEFMVRAQKAAKIFFIISWPIGIAGGIASLFINTSINKVYLFVIIIISTVMFGYSINYFGRRGYLPFPEE